MSDMPEPTPSDPTSKLRVIATTIVDGVGEGVARFRSKLRFEHEAVEAITDLLTAPPVEDPLILIHEIEDRLGVDHHDWTKYGQWVRHSTTGD